MGVDRVIFIIDRKFGGVDILVIFNIIVVVIRKIEDIDLIVVGR